MSTAEIKTQKPKKRFNKKIAIIIASVLIIGSVVGVKYYSKKQPKPTMVSTVKAEKSNLVKTVPLTGNVDAEEKYEVVLNSTQKVAEILVKEGQLVKKGDVILRYDSMELNQQLKKAQLSLENAQSNLNKITSDRERTSLENSVNIAEINLETSKANYEEANKKLTQNKALFEKGFISQNEYETSQRNVNEMEGQVRTSEMKVVDAKKALSDLASGGSDKVEEQNRQIKLAQLDIESIQSKLQTLEVKSNIDGKVVKLDGKVGDYPKNGDSIVIYNTDSYILNLKASQYDAISLVKDQKAEIKIKGIDKKYTGIISEIGMIADKITTTSGQENKVNVKVKIDNADEQLKVGFEADVDITLDEKKDTIAINFDAVKKDKDGSDYIFVTKDGKAAKKKVKVGLESDISVEIEEGLADGEEFISNPPETLKEGDLVNSASEVKKK